MSILKLDGSNGLCTLNDTDLVLGEIEKHSECPVYYISDIHLEHQICNDPNQMSPNEELWASTMRIKMKVQIKKKVSELTKDLPKEAILLFAGDISRFSFVHKMFLEEMDEVMRSRDADWAVIYVLGNHELCDEQIFPRLFLVRSTHYIHSWETYPQRIIENSILVRQKKRLLIGGTAVAAPLEMRWGWKDIRESELLQMDPATLREQCDNSIIILGGTGYSGLNCEFNADAGLYRGKVDRAEELVRTARFNAVYEKLKKCIPDKQVIVLTHMPVSDWTNNPLVPNWIYINGHTHRNFVSVKEGEATILADNQIGYQPKTLSFKRFFIRKWSDMFSEYPDGIYAITNEQYIEFQQGRGVASNGCKRKGTIRMLKRNGIYMFFLDGKKLSILNGGQIKTAQHPIEYYYERLDKYAARVETVFAPYLAALNQISSEVESFGGWGSIHGSIIDIDYYGHIFLDPFTGMATPYFAIDKGESWACSFILELFDKYKEYYQIADNYHACLPMHPIWGWTQSRPPADIKGMRESYSALMNKQLLPVLSMMKADRKLTEASWETDTSGEMDPHETAWKKTHTIMYSRSAIMRALQYLFETNIVRVWNDAVFVDEQSENALAPLSLSADIEP